MVIGPQFPQSDQGISSGLDAGPLSFIQRSHQTPEQSQRPFVIQRSKESSDMGEHRHWLKHLS
jgi:hypothetical protein